MIWPGDERAAAAGRGYMRTSHADREQMIDALKLAFVEGRLTKDELDTRIGRALCSRTYAELATVAADIPAPPAAAPLAAAPRRPPGRPGQQVSSAARWGTSGFVTPAILAAAFAIASTRGGGGYGAVAFVVAFGYFLFWLSVGANMLWEWHRTSLPGVHLCVRCGHTAASHHAPASCTAPVGSANLWRRCACTGYVPPGESPKSVRHALPTHG